MKLPKWFVPIFAATAWIGLSEFFRNSILLHHYWMDHYNSIGVVFPEKPINGAIWGIWSLVFATCIYVIATKFSLLQTMLLAWTVGFVLMWLVIGNLRVLPYALLIFAVPLSLLEVFVAVWIIKKLQISPR